MPKKYTYTIWALAILLLISLSANLYLLFPGEERGSIVGTYQTVNGSQYIILEESGEYCWYQPGQVLETGRYEKYEDPQYVYLNRDPGVEEYILTQDAAAAGPGARCVLLTGDLLLLTLDDGTIFKMEKFADFPYYNNVPEGG